MNKKVIEIIKKEIESTKEGIEESYLESYYEKDFVENVDDLINECMNWGGNDICLSFEVGYYRALEILINTLEKEEE